MRKLEYECTYSRLNPPLIYAPSNIWEGGEQRIGGIERDNVHTLCTGIPLQQTE